MALGMGDLGAMAIAILAAVVSWPLRAANDEKPHGSVSCSSVRASRRASPRLQSRSALMISVMVTPSWSSTSDDLAARHQPVVDEDVDGLADAAVELEHGAGPELQQLADLHLGAAEHGRDL